MWSCVRLAPWPRKRLVLTSPEGIEDVRAGLYEQLGSSRLPSLVVRPGLVARGFITRDRVRIVVAHSGWVNAWRPVLRGRLTATETGCQLVCYFGWSVAVELFCALWLIPFGLMSVIGAGSAVFKVIVGDFGGTAEAATVAGLSAGFILMRCVLIAFSQWMARGEIRALRCWLAERFQFTSAV